MNQFPASSSDNQPAPAAPAEPTPTTVPVRVTLPVSVPYVTYSIIGITVLFYLAQLASVGIFGYASSISQLDWVEVYGAKVNEFIRAGELWRFITPILLHGSVPHILFNMYALYAFGANLERYFGHRRFLLLYLLGGFTGNVMSFLLSSGYSVGASTAIFGLVGAEGVFLYQNRKMFGSQFRGAIGNIIFVVVVNLLFGLAPGIDNWGHVGGLLGGLVFSWFAGPLWEITRTVSGLELSDKRGPREVLTGAAVVVLIFGALAMVGMFYPVVP